MNVCSAYKENLRAICDDRGVGLVVIRKRKIHGDVLVLYRIILGSAESEPVWGLGTVGFVHEADVEGIFAEERANLVNLRRTNKKTEVLGGASEEWV